MNHKKTSQERCRGRKPIPFPRDIRWAPAFSLPFLSGLGKGNLVWSRMSEDLGSGALSPARSACWKIEVTVTSLSPTSKGPDQAWALPEPQGHGGPSKSGLGPSWQPSRCQKVTCLQGPAGRGREWSQLGERQHRDAAWARVEMEPTWEIPSWAHLWCDVL